MIPLRLHIKNFLSYGSPTQIINFEPYHLICLSGKNGHGKSALLDAITWSLWGQARKAASAARSDANLLRMGQNTMMVALDFVCNKRTYRVRREYQNAEAKNIAYLDFGIYDEQSQQWRQLTTKSIRETQDLIISIVGLSAEAFENSAFLRQGHSDSFSRKSPKDRKEMLAHILGLGAYELLRKKALEQSKEEQMRYQNSSRSCELLKLSITPYHQTQQTLATLQEHYRLHHQKEQQCVEQAQSLRTELQSLYKEQQKINEKRALAVHITNQITLKQQELHLIWNQWRFIQREHRLLHQKEPRHKNREFLLHELAITQQSMQNHLITAQRIALIKQHMHEHVVAQKQKHEALLSPLKEHKNNLEQQKNIIEHDKRRFETECASLKQAQQLLSQEHTPSLDVSLLLPQNEALIAATDHDLERTQELLHKATFLRQRIMRDQERIEKEQLSLTNSTTPLCASCFQPVKATYLAQIQLLRTKQLKRFAHQRTRIDTIIAMYQKKLKELQAVAQKLRTEHKELSHQQTRYTAYHERKQELEVQLNNAERELKDTKDSLNKAHHKLEIVEIKVQGLEQEHLTSQSCDQKLKNWEQQLQDDEKIIEKTAHAHISYQELQKELAQIAAEDLQRAKLLQEIQAQSERKQTIYRLCTDLRNFKKQHCDLVPAYEQHQAIATNICAKEQAEQEAQHERSKLLQEKEKLATQQGALEQTIRHIEQQINLLEQEKTQSKLYEDNITDYNLLAQILSKDGIQGMLIEHVLPEIEHEANMLLAKLTDNQAQLCFESLRGLKSGALKETLEIKIADALGVRPYELFSGGEAFRIDFALRLAISKLLARRAGASIQTLIIDEGFGSQDEEGLHHIMESLYAIQDEFAKIIIVSHLPVMKDQFPTHFYIHKGMQGSTVHLVEQG